MKITTVIENSTVRHNLLCSHGQSLLIEHDGKKILFDVSEVSEGLLYNLNALGSDLDSIDKIVISHNHIDHLGGITKILTKLSKQELLLTSDVGVAQVKPAGPKYVFIDGGKSENYNVSVSAEVAKDILSYSKSKVISEGYEILPNLFTTGSIGNNPKEQSLVFNQNELGITIILGCSHPGLKEIIKKSKEITQNPKVRGILGGLHLNKMNEQEIKEIAAILKAENLEFILPNHCTGIEQTILLKKYIGEVVKYSKTISFGTGNSVTIDEKVTFDWV
jgi:7,8-dihydropterin-6-yl-methyl-4-(beta-D-ribofuranosyl)aminobenzene 5'-phosphate synthase